MERLAEEVRNRLSLGRLLLAAACLALPGGEEQAGILGSLPSHHTHHDLQTKLCEGQQGQVLLP